MLLVKTEVRPSPIHGLGLFAAEPITAGRTVWRWASQLDRMLGVSTFELLPSTDPLRDFLWHFGWRNAFGDWYVCLDDARYINHAFQPSIHHRNGVLDSYAARDIAIGEELTEDYRTFDPDFEQYGKEWR